VITDNNFIFISHALTEIHLWIKLSLLSGNVEVKVYSSLLVGMDMP